MEHPAQTALTVLADRPRTPIARWQSLPPTPRAAIAMGVAIAGLATLWAGDVAWESRGVMSPDTFREVLAASSRLTPLEGIERSDAPLLWRRAQAFATTVHAARARVTTPRESRICDEWSLAADAYADAAALDSADQRLRRHFFTASESDERTSLVVTWLSAQGTDTSALPILRRRDIDALPTWHTYDGIGAWIPRTEVARILREGHAHRHRAEALSTERR